MAPLPPSTNDTGFTPLSSNEAAKLKLAKHEELRRVGGRTGTQRDNEFGDGSVSGIISTFYTKDAFETGWSRVANKHLAPQDREEEKKDPTNKIYGIAMGIGAAVGIAIGVLIGLPFGPVGIAIGVAVGAAVGGLLGAIDGYFESRKVKQEIIEGERAAQKSVDGIRKDTTLEKQNERLNQLESLLQQRTNDKHQDQHQTSTSTAQRDLPNVVAINPQKQR